MRKNSWLWSGWVLVGLFLPAQGGRNTPEDEIPGEKPGKKSGKSIPSLLQNGGFEGGTFPYPGNWLPGLPTSPSVKAGLDTKDPVEGSNCLALQNYDAQVTAPLLFTQFLGFDKISPYIGRELRLTGSVRTENSAFADIEAEGVDNAGKTIARISLTKGGIKGTQGWKEFEVSLILPQGLSALKISCGLMGTGTAWFDDIRLKPVPIADTESLKPLLDEARVLVSRYVRAEAGSEEANAKEALSSLQSAPTETLLAIVAKGFAHDSMPGGKPRDEYVRTGGKAKYQITLPGGYDPKKNWPLAIVLSPAPAVGGTEAWADKVALVARMKGTSVSGLAEVLADARAKYAVDPDRIAIIGIEGACDAAATTALSRRGDVAALVLIRPSGIPEGYEKNAKGLPVYIALDGGDRSQLVSKFQALRNAGAGVLFRDLDPARDPAAALKSEIFSWLSSKMRPASPMSFEESLFSAAEPGSFWVEILERAPGSAEAQIKAAWISPQQAKIHLEGVRRFRLFLGDELFEEGSFLQVEVGETLVYEGRPQFSFDRFLEGLRSRADYRRIWAGSIDLNAP